VLLTGETGTGKDLAARTIHDISDRANRSFIQITCSALPDQLLESELFGHERGAFTDARCQKPGLLEVADTGTVFLDEIGDMTLPLQAKLIRFLDDKTFRRVGGLRDIRVDVRIVAATHCDLHQQVRENRFRDDLFYRLNVLPIHLPPLRDRLGDLSLLVDYFIDQYNVELGRNVRGMKPSALALLKRYHWPGNVRELRNTIERGMLLTDKQWLEAGDVSIPVHSIAQPRYELPPSGVNLGDVERELLAQALERAQWNQTRAAELLGVNRDQVRYRMQKYRIPGPRKPRTASSPPAPSRRRSRPAVAVA
jgi:transcriptional regulator with PAS, ATPase and Fis domain